MRGSKAKKLRRIRWTGVPNGRLESYDSLKRKFKKGVPIGLWGYYPRQGRDWRELMK